MKTVLKVCLGLFLGGTLLFGGVFLAGKAMLNNSNVYSIETVETTDTNGKTTAVSTVSNNGTVTTTTYNVMKKDVTFTNQTNLTFEDIEMESNLEDEMSDMDDMMLMPGFQTECTNVSFHEDVKTVDIVLEDENDNTYVCKGVDVSGIKNMSQVNFVITQQGNTISVSVAK